MPPQAYTLLGQPIPSSSSSMDPAVAGEEGRLLLHPFSLEDDSHAPTGSARAAAAVQHGRSRTAGLANWKMLVKIGCTGLSLGATLTLILYLTLSPSPDPTTNHHPLQHHPPQPLGPDPPPAPANASSHTQTPAAAAPPPASNLTADDFSCPGDLVLSPSDRVFFIVGDWGRQGSSTQTLTAHMMAQVSQCMPPSFIISTGDNFYPYGLSSSRDPQMEASFSGVYSAPGLQVPWYAVLGNHDYGDSLPKLQLQDCPAEPDPQLGATELLAQCRVGGQGCCFSPLWQVRDNTSAPENGVDSRWHLRQGAWQMDFGQGLEITFIDTSPFIQDYHTKHWATLIGGLSSHSGHKQREQQQALIESLLNTSSTRTKLVVGHHPVHSNGDHCHGKTSDIEECDDVGTWLRPLLQQHKVLAYISGHEHDLQFINRTDESTLFVISGAGSDVNYDKTDNQKHLHGSIFRDQGFIAAALRQGQLSLYYYVHGQRQPILTTTLGA